MGKLDPFGEFEDTGEEIDVTKYIKDISLLNYKTDESTERKYRLQGEGNNSRIPLFVITPEMQAERELYRTDFVLAHEKLFPMSTGVKPYGEEQQKAVRRFQKIVQGRGKLVQAEPRGFAKTSRAVNQILLGILQGDIRFCLIVSSALDKSVEIMEQITTELTSNNALARLYPTIVACFKGVEGKPQRAPAQNIGGEPTKIEMTRDSITFPIVTGELSSGARILVKTKDNIRGLSSRIRAGEEAGKGLRPDFILLDDIQTDKDALSPTVSNRIARTIKRSALFSGSHTKKIRCILTITPNSRGDVASHFILKEPSWEVAKYSMMVSMPKNMERWEEYGAILLNFNKEIEGDRERAQIRAREFVRENYDILHEGAIPSWEWAYDWESDDSIELSATQHAMTIYFEEGEEAFMYECQCILAEDSINEDAIKASQDQILSRISHLPRYSFPSNHMYIVTHIDCNKDFLSYVTATSGQMIEPNIIDYGTWPPQETAMWTKRNIYTNLAKHYPAINREDTRLMIYQAVKDLIPILATRQYTREEGAKFYHRLIGIDINWEMDSVLSAMRESQHRSLLIAMQGVSYKAKDKPMMEIVSNEREKHFHCYSTITSDNTMPLLKVDTNYIKSFIHKGFVTVPGNAGSYRLYAAKHSEDHLLYSEHLVNENVHRAYNEKEDRYVDEWSEQYHKDNEYFDNTVGITALFFRLGCHMKSVAHKKSMDMKEYMQAQQNKVNKW
jgi:hypothetical protein